MQRVSGLKICLLVMSCLGVLVGCGKKNDGPPRFDVNGTVNYNDAPLPNGRISFVPDAQKGNEGPVGYAQILDGKFDTTAVGGKGTISGPIEVLITGYDLTTTPDGELKPPLFDDFKASADIDPEKKKTTLHFDVKLVPKKR